MGHDTIETAGGTHPLLDGGELDATDLVVSVKDRHGRYIAVNRGFEEFLGLPRERLEGKTDGALNPQDIAERVSAHDHAVLAGGGPTDVEETLLGRDGRRRMRCFRFALLGGGVGGEAWGVCSVSAPKERADAAREERDRLMALAGAADGWTPPAAAVGHARGVVVNGSDDGAKRTKLESALADEHRARRLAEEQRARHEQAAAQLARERTELAAALEREQAELARAVKAQEDLGRRLEAAKEELAAARASLSADGSELDRVRAQLAETQAAAAESNATLEAVRAQLSEQSSRSQAEAERLEGELAAVREQLAATQEELSAARASLAADDSELGRLRADLASALASSGQANAELDRVRAQLAETQAAAAQSDAALEAVRAQLGEQSSQARAEAERLQGELAAVKDELAAARASLAADDSELGRLRADLASALASSGHANTELDHMRSQLAEMHAAATESDAALEAARRQLSELSSHAQTDAARLQAELESERRASALAQGELERLRAELEAARVPAEVEPEPAPAPAAPHPAAAPPALLGVQRKVSARIASATSIEGALRVALAELGAGAGWDVAVGWLPDRSGARLRPAAVWCSPELAGTQFETQSWQATIAEGPQAIARTWESREPAWIDDLSPEGERPRVRWAQAAGLSTAVAVPIADDESARGLLELYRREAMPREEAMLEVLTTVGVQLAGAARLLELADKPRWR